MNKFIKIALFFLTGLLYGTSEAQTVYKTIEIRAKNGESINIGNNSNFNFIGGNGVKYNARVHIINDSQFVFYNFFNELEKDTFNIKFVNFVSLYGGSQKYKIRPVLVALGLIFTPLLTVPVLIFKLLARKKTYQWVGKEDFTIKISIRETEI